MKYKGITVLLLAVVLISLTAFLLVRLFLPGYQERETKPFRFAVVTWVNHGPFYLAEKKGFYERYGLQVDIQKIEDIGAQKLALQSGELDATISSVDFFATAAAEGVEAKTVMKLGAGNGADAIIADHTIRGIQDLKAKSVAFEKGSPSHFFLLVVLDEAGLRSEDIIPRYMTAADAGAAYAAGRVDACVTWEPWVSNATRSRASTVLATSRDRSGYLVDTFVVRNDVLAGRRDDVKKFMMAWFDAIEYWKQHPDEGNRLMAEGLGIPLSDFVAMLAGVKLADYKDNLAYFGRSDGDGRYWQVFKQANKVYRREGVIGTPGDPREFTDTSLLLELGAHQ